MMKLSRATRKTKRCEERANTQTKRVLALLLHKSIGIKNNMNEKELNEFWDKVQKVTNGKATGFNGKGRYNGKLYFDMSGEEAERQNTQK